jgi:hypothetical protein
MNKLWVIVLLIVLSGVASAQTTTPNIGLTQIPHNFPAGWDSLYNSSMGTIDTVVGQLQSSYQGSWSSSTTYAKGQMVQYSNALYQSTINSNTNNVPGSTQWTLVLSLASVATALSGSANDSTARTSASAAQTTANTAASSTAAETTRATAAEATKQPLLATSSTVPVSCTSGQLWTNPSPTGVNNVGAVCYSNVWYYLQTIMSGTPNTPIVDSGTPTSTYPAYVAGSTDGNGYINLNLSAAPTAGVGLLTVQFSMTYPSIPNCSLRPANLVTAELVGTAQPFISQNSQTTSQFVIYNNSTVISTGVTYEWGYSCHL